MPSEKSAVFEYLFREHWDPVTSTLRQTVMTQPEVIRAIEHCNAADGLNRSARNPANFCKDAVRNTNASANWPAFIAEKRYTAVQRSGDSRVFEFVPYAPGQTEPFPDIYKFRDGVAIHPVQSLSMLNESKMLGRTDEPWLTQTAVNLRVVETHFAVESPERAKIVDLIHLQMSLKLRYTEVDAFFMARIKLPDSRLVIVGITCEAKGANERVLENQLVQQAKAAFEQGGFEFVIPIAIRNTIGRGIYLAEFQGITRAQAETYEQPVLVAEALYELHPRVPGI